MNNVSRVGAFKQVITIIAETEASSKIRFLSLL